MKRKPITIVSALLMAAAMTQAKDIWAPDRRARLECTSSIDLFDEQSQSMLTLIPNARDAKRVEVAWSPDSSKVAIAVDYERGSVIFAAWLSDGVWRKTLQSDEDQAAVSRSLPGRLVAESRRFGAWTSLDSLQVKGELTYANGRRVPYVYTLEFTGGQVRLDRGGYLEGEIKGRNYQIL